MTPSCPGRATAIATASTLATLLLALAAASAPAQSVPPSQAERVARIESSLVLPRQVEGREVSRYTLAERMAHHGVPGVSIAVIEDGRVAWAKGYGVKDVATGAPVTPTTLFQAASISKPVAVMGMLRLVEDGRLDLDADVDDYLESWRLPAYDYASRVTLRRLASHTAGTTVHGFPGYARSAERPGPAGVLRGEGNTPAVVVDLEPGTGYRYSGGGLTILQLVVEDVTGRPFEDYIAAAVLAPAGMDHSTFAQPLPEALWDQAASGYRPDGTEVEEGWHVYPEKAAAGLWTTPTDLAHLAVEVQRSLEGDANHVLSPDMTRRMLEPVMGSYGLGWGTVPEQSGRFSHGGANEGFRAMLVAFRDGRGAVVMTNSDRGGALYQEILAAIGLEYGWDELQPQTLALAPLTPARRDALGGHYTVPALGDGRITLTATADGLFDATGDRITDTTLVPVSDTELVDLTDGVRLIVEWDGDRVVRIRTQGIELVPEGG